jgi:hypothetical protein
LVCELNCSMAKLVNVSFHFFANFHFSAYD